MVWARRRRVTTSSTTAEVNVRAIPLLPAGGWRLYGVEEWPLIGTAPKNYLAYGDPERPDCVSYIAKKGRFEHGGLRECVTEEIISQIGAMLPLRVAKSKLVRLPVSSGLEPDVRFLSRNFIRRGEEQLVHGIELAAQYFNAQPQEVEAVFNLTDRSAERAFYTMSNVVEVFTRLCRPGELDRILDGLARMLAFDAFVGASDRHSLNWGVIAQVSGQQVLRRFAPVFDTARGLFWDHTDEKLTDVGRNGRQDAFIRSYADRSKPVFGKVGQGENAQRCSHFDLVECALTDMPSELGNTMARFVNGIDLPAVEVRVRRKFTRIISRTRMSFIVGLLRYRLDRLKSLVHTNRK